MPPHEVRKEAQDPQTAPHDADSRRAREAGGPQAASDRPEPPSARRGLPRKDLFNLPEGVIYMDGNSLGPLPRAVPARVAEVVGAQWGEMLIRAWNLAGWMDLPERVGARVARLIGAPAGSVTMGDTLSIKVFQALAAALSLRPGRRVVLSDSGNFPSDLHVAGGLLRLAGGRHRLETPPPEAVAERIEAIGADLAAVMLTHVDYRTGRMHDMAAITRRAHAAGAVVIWDLAHSAGAVPLDLAGIGAEFAVGCTYKFLNGGPGAPAFIHVRPDIAEAVDPALAGWLGHADPFAMSPEYRPAPGVRRFRVGTPPVIQMAALDAALDVFDGVDMGDIRARAIALSECFIAEVERRCPQLRLVSPRDPQARGSQVSLAHPEAHAAMQALIARGVIGDFRAPDVMRFGITPLYQDEDDMRAAAAQLAEVMSREEWREPRFRVRAAVT